MLIFVFFLDKDCLLCHFVSNVSELKDHYCNFHGVNCKDPHFLDLFKPDYLENNKCSECSVAFSNCRKKKNHMFLFHHGQLGGARNDRGAPLNISKRGYITYYSVNFRQHKTHYDFYSSDMVDVFLDAVHRTFPPHGNLAYKFQSFFEIMNQQRTPDNNNFLTENRSWITNVFRFKYFNEYLRGELKNEINKRIINNGFMGNSWYFLRFERLNVIVVPLIKESKIITT